MFKDRYYKQFIESYGELTSVFAINSAYSIIGLWDIVKNYFYSKDVSDYITEVQNNISQKDFIDKIRWYYSDEFFSRTKESRFDYIIFSFYDYFFSRLPVLRLMTFDGKYRLTEQEVDDISRASFIVMDKLYKNNFKNYKFSGMYSDFLYYSKIPRFIMQFRLRDIDDKVYSVNWLLEKIEQYYPEYSLDCNVNNFSLHVLESCFPMYWDEFSSYIVKSIIYAANLGYVYWKKDIEELLENNN